MSFWLESFLYRHADQVVVNSPGFINLVKAHGAKDVMLVPNGVDPQMFDPAADGKTYRQENNLGSNFIILYAGAHGISNDLIVVLSAARLTLDHPEIQYVFVGDGKEKQHLIETASEWQLTNVHFLPPVAKNGMKEVLAAANVCLAILQPIQMYKTTYPNKVFDYLAAGRPVLLAIDGVIRQVVEEAHAGLFVPPGDAEAMAKAILQLAADCSGARKMGMNGRDFVSKHFNRLELSTRFDMIFRELVKKK